MRVVKIKTNASQRTFLGRASQIFRAALWNQVRVSVVVEQLPPPPQIVRLKGRAAFVHLFLQSEGKDTKIIGAVIHTVLIADCHDKDEIFFQ